MSLTVPLACTEDEPDRSAESVSSERDATAPRTFRYVAPSGRDDWPGTKHRPWRTLARAIEAVYRGQTLYVRGGVYREHLDRLQLHRGTSSRPIVVRSYPGERPVLRGSIALNRPMYWRVSGINVTADPSTPQDRAGSLVKVAGGLGWSWTNSEIWGSLGATNVLVVGKQRVEPSNWSLSYNCIHDVATTARVTRTSNVTLAGMGEAGPGLVSRNLIFGDRAELQVAIGAVEGGGPTDVRLTNNTIYGGQVPVTIAGDTSSVRLQRNLIGGGTADVVVRWSPSSGAADNEVSQNLGTDALTFLRPLADESIGGPGNIIADSLSFDEQSCDGFKTTESVALPYGRYGVG
ncbi:MAG: hypothetical protein ACRDO2_12475 [Nocardioidaceae bacterium]